MKIPLRIGVLVLLLASSAWAGANLNLSKSNINRLARGTIVTASAGLSGQVSQIVYTVPGSGDFVLTQVCVGNGDGGVLVQGGGVSLAQVGSGLCQTFSPGLLLAPEALLTCTSFDARANSFCTISGILAPPLGPTPTPRA